MFICKYVKQTTITGISTGRKRLPRETGIELPRCLSGKAALHLSLLHCKPSYRLSL